MVVSWLATLSRILQTGDVAFVVMGIVAVVAATVDDGYDDWQHLNQVAYLFSNVPPHP